MLDATVYRCSGQRSRDREFAMRLMKRQVALSLENILLAVDFSAASESAVRYARAIARQCMSEVHTVHVNGPDSYHLLPPEAFRVAVRDRQEPADDIVHVVEILLQGLPNEVPLRHGGIWEVIADVVSRNKIDLLVLGTHGRSGLPKFLLGSVAEQIFRNVSCPVLTVGPQAYCVREKLEFRSILLASDLDPRSAAPLYASWLCNEFKGSLTALHVARDNGEESNPKGKQAIQAGQLETILSLEGSASAPRVIVEHGPPAARILEKIDDLRPDVVVLGARHPAQSTLATHLPWSTASRVIAESRCPVLTVRELR
jgi:nucleotide-binding universal stress UspA family protein